MMGGDEVSCFLQYVLYFYFSEELGHTYICSITAYRFERFRCGDWEPLQPLPHILSYECRDTVQPRPLRIKGLENG